MVNGRESTCRTVGRPILYNVPGLRPSRPIIAQLPRSDDRGYLLPALPGLREPTAGMVDERADATAAHVPKRRVAFIAGRPVMDVTRVALGPIGPAGIARTVRFGFDAILRWSRAGGPVRFEQGPHGSYPRFGASQRSISASGIPLRRA